MRPRTSGASAISSSQSIYYMVKVLLAVFVGLFRGQPGAGASAGAADGELAARGEDRARRSSRSARLMLLASHMNANRSSSGSRSSSSRLICGLIFELIRRKRLMERYAILWLLAGVTVVVLSVGQDLLVKLTHAAGISYAPSAVFAVAFLFVLAMLVQFSMTISRLSDQNTALAQRLALLQAAPRAGRGERAAGAPSRAPGAQLSHRSRLRGETVAAGAPAPPARPAGRG